MYYVLWHVANSHTLYCLHTANSAATQTRTGLRNGIDQIDPSSFVKGLTHETIYMLICSSPPSNQHFYVQITVGQALIV